MKELFIADLPADSSVILFAVVASRELKDKKDGKQYISMSLADRTGSVDSKLWDDVETIGGLFSTGDIVKVQGVTGEYRGKPQLTVRKLRLATSDEVDRADYIEASARDVDEMRAEVEGAIAGISDDLIRTVVGRVMEDPKIGDKFWDAPAAKGVHDAVLHGLCEHVCALIKLSNSVCDQYPSLNRDLMVAACVLHDIGKCSELQIDMAISYTTPGQLLGHVAIGFYLLNKHCDQMEDFPEILRMKLGHMILSHHGILEWGALKIPAFPEAAVFHLLDRLCASMSTMRKAYDMQGDDEFTPFVRAMDTQLFRK